MSLESFHKNRRHYHLGLLSLSVEATVDPHRFEAWLPQTGQAADRPPAATLWVGGSDTRNTLGGPGRHVAGGVSVWVDDTVGRASLLGPAGHSELDLRELWGKVTPRAGAGEVGPLLSAGTGLLLGRAGVVLMSASAVVDVSGGGWLIVGSQESRSLLSRAFVRDGCEFVSDDQLLLRPARRSVGSILLESWHRSPRRETSSKSAADLPASAWRPVAPLRGVILSRTGVDSRSRPWKVAARDRALATLVDASPYVDCDTAVSGALMELLGSCCARPAVEAVVSGEGERGRGRPLSRLAEAIDDIL
jgi:hypothetical protein